MIQLNLKSKNQTTNEITLEITQANQTVQAMKRPMRRLKSAIERSKKWKERDKSMPKVGAGVMPAHDLTLNNNASQWNAVLLELDASIDILKDIFTRVRTISPQPPPFFFVCHINHPPYNNRISNERALRVAYISPKGGKGLHVVASDEHAHVSA